MTNLRNLSCIIILTCLCVTVSGDCTCQDEPETSNKSEALKFKLGAIASILISGAIGVSLPLLGRKFKPLRPENDIFFMIKAFAAGVILATAFVHILPDAFQTLTSPCLAENPWRKFPFAGLVAMVSSIGTLMVDAVGTSYYKNMHLNKSGQVNVDEEASHVHSHSQVALVPSPDSSTSDIIRQRVITQVLELGIVVHSVIIGISLGASENTKTIKPLMAALSFHQLFEGIGLGGCISQAKFKSMTSATMAVFFSLTAPVGIGIGIGISSAYKGNSSTALAVEGTFNSASAGILIYMSLVDLLAADFMNQRMQSNVRLQLGAYVSLLLGSGCMSLLAKWA